MADDPNGTKKCMESDEDSKIGTIGSASTSKTEGSMDGLPMEKQCAKDSSLEEDLLGAESLMMSDSDDEQDSKNKQKSPDANKNSERQCSIPEKNVNSPASKSEVIENKSLEEEAAVASEDLHKSDEDDEFCVVKPRTQSKKRATIIDSDSENENYADENEKEKPAVKKNSESTESESENGNKENEKKNRKKLNKKKPRKKSNDIADETLSTSVSEKKQKISTLIDSDSESDSAMSERHHEVETENFANIDGDAIHNDSDLSGNEGGSDGFQSKKSAKPMRASAKKALDDMQAIQSEQQRLHREAQISIPYHKPKRHTLQEFLNRRTIIRPAACNDDSSAGMLLQKKSLKMTTEELQEYAHLMEERAKEAAEFFKSESEDENDEGANKEIQTESHTPPTTPPPPSRMTPSPLSMQGAVKEDAFTEGNDGNQQPDNINELSHQGSTSINTDNAEMKINDKVLGNELAVDKTDICSTDSVLNVSSKPDLLGENDASMLPVEVASSQPIITEVVDLPRLNLSSMHINADVDLASESVPMLLRSPAEIKKHLENENLPETDEVTAWLNGADKKARALEKIIAEKHIKHSPRIKGDPSMIIDLESGDLIAKRPAAADDLLQRLLATHRARKDGKRAETVNILSTDNGKVEVSKISINLKKDEIDPNREHKPGAAYMKLKENLKSLIKKKRLQELHKKQGEEENNRKCLDDEENSEDEYDEVEEMDEGKPNLHSDSIVIDDEENAIDLNDDAAETETAIDFEEEEENEDEDNITLKQDDDDEDEVDGNSDNHNDEDSSDNENNDSDSDNEREEDVLEKNNTKCASNDIIENTQQRRNRIVKGFQNDSDDDDDIDLLKTQIPVKATTIKDSIFSVEGIAGSQSIKSNSEESSCFGSFVNGGPLNEAAVISQIPITQMPTVDHEGADKELLELCSGTFEGSNSADAASQAISCSAQNEQPTQMIASEEVFSEQTQPESMEAMEKSLASDIRQTESHSNETKGRFRIVSSDEDNTVQDTKQRVKRLRKKLKKGQIKLGFSDDEDDEDKDFDDEDVSDGGDMKDAENDLTETYVDYDSEENEVLVSMTKKDCRKKAGAFVEQEAELSESEWGSADEDEKDLDTYDMELGDEDEFDRDQLRSELEKIHARKMLDEDIREVRKIKEMLMEDEEVDGVGRQRQFRWRNAETGFSLDDGNNLNAEGSAMGQNDSGDEENEHIWRKIRYERQQLLEQNALQEDMSTVAGTPLMNPNEIRTATGLRQQSSLTIISNTNSGAETSPAIGTVKRINVLTTTKKSASLSKANSPFLIAKTLQSTTLMSVSSSTASSPATSAAKTSETAATTPTTVASLLGKKTPARGSFLIRDREILAKIAGLTKGGKLAGAANDEQETAGTVLVKDVKAKNFVFTTLTEEEHEQHLKRKADVLLNSSAENSNFGCMKKPRKNDSNARRQCVIDQLL